MIFDKGLTLTLKLDDKQVKEITELFRLLVTKARTDLESDIETLTEGYDNLSDKIERLSK